MDLIRMGQRIRTARENLSYTREQFSELCNISPRFCYDIEAGLKGVSLETIRNISKVLHVSVDYLISAEIPDEKDYALFLALMEQCPEEHLAGLKNLMQIYVHEITTASNSQKDEKENR